MKHSAEVKFIMEDKVFVNDEGKQIAYVEHSIIFNGEKFVVTPRKSDKPLLRYFRANMKEEN